MENSYDYSEQGNNNTKLHFDGKILINSEYYLAKDILEAFQGQGILINQIGSKIKIGHRSIAPIKPTNVDDPMAESVNKMNLEVLHGLTGQIQRIFSELGKLKSHLGINGDLLSEMELKINNNTIPNNQDASFQNKWKDYGSKGTKELENKYIPFIKNNNEISSQNDVPIIALGMKKSKSNNQKNLIDDYKDLSTLQGISEDEVLDNLSSRLFKTANESLSDTSNKTSVIDILQPNEQIQNHPIIQKKSEIIQETSFLRRCGHCKTKVPQEAKFCSKCGNKSK